MRDRSGSEPPSRLRPFVARALYVILVASLFLVAMVGSGVITRRLHSSDMGYAKFFLTGCLLVLPRLHFGWNDDAALVTRMILVDTMIAFALALATLFILASATLHRSSHVWDPLIAAAIGAIFGFCSFQCAAGFDIMLQLVGAAWKERHKHFRPW